MSDPYPSSGVPYPDLGLSAEQEIRARALDLACKHLAKVAPEAAPKTVLEWADMYATYIRDGSNR